MFLFDSYDAAFQSCIDTNSFAIAKLNQLKRNTYVDTSACCKIFILLSGDKTFHIGEQIYNATFGDLFFISSNNWHFFSDFSEGTGHERIVLFLSPFWIKNHSTNLTNLNRVFEQSECFHRHRISLSKSDFSLILELIDTLSTEDTFGSDTLNLCHLLELLVHCNRLYLNYTTTFPEESVSPLWSQRVQDIISYINEHLTDNISAETLSEQFFLSTSYLYRLFKAETGTTVHKYITTQRIIMAKDLLASGYPVSQVFALCGFNDYSHFIKVFKASVGLPPKRYAILFSKVSIRHQNKSFVQNSHSGALLFAVFLRCGCFWFSEKHQNKPQHPCSHFVSLAFAS